MPTHVVRGSTVYTHLCQKRRGNVIRQCFDPVVNGIFTCVMLEFGSETPKNWPWIFSIHCSEENPYREGCLASQTFICIQITPIDAQLQSQLCVSP